MKTYLEAPIVKTVWSWPLNKLMDQWNRTQSAN